MKLPIKVGDYVICEGEDSYFEGEVVSVFEKLNGHVRYVIEDDRGLLLIKGPKNITVYFVSSGNVVTRFYNE